MIDSLETKNIEPSFRTVLILLISSIAYYIYYIYFKRKSQLPIVPYIPIIGHTFEIRNNAKQFLEKCRAKYGDAFAINLQGHRVVVLANEQTSAIMKAQDLGVLDARSEIFSLHHILGESKETGAPHNEDGSLSLVKEKILPLLKKVFPNVIKVMSMHIKTLIGKGTDSKGIDLLKSISKVITKSIMVVIVGEELANNEELQQILMTYIRKAELIQMVFPFWDMVPLIGKYISKRRAISSSPGAEARSLIKNQIQQCVFSRKEMIARGTAPEANSTIDFLIDEGYSLEEIAQAVMFLTFSSISTTAGFCFMAIKNYLAFPEVFSAIRQEQEEVLKDVEKDKDGDWLFDTESLEKMHHISSSIRETLRHRSYRLELWRVNSVDRTLPNGLFVPKGEFLAIDFPSLHFNSKDYTSSLKGISLSVGFEDPSQDYYPFQYVPKKTKASQLTKDFLGFGSGRNACPGRFFAVHEMTAFISILLSNYRIETLDGKNGDFVTHFEGYSDSFAGFKPLKSK